MENAGGNGKKRGPSLFERMTGSGRARRETADKKPAGGKTARPRTAPPAAQKPVGEAGGKEPTFENITPPAQPVADMQSIEDDPLEIPAFLRRQAN